MSAGHPYFPSQSHDAQGAPDSSHYFGVSIREHIATQLMAGLLANGSYMDAMKEAACSSEPLILKGVAVVSVRAADALLAALNRETP